MSPAFRLSHWRPLILLPGAWLAAQPGASPAHDGKCLSRGELVTVTSVGHTFHELFRRACDGESEAQLELAKRYHVGDGLPESPRDAAHWYRRAAHQGIAEAQYQLGAMYLEGNGVTEDSVEALRWISLAAEHAHPQARVLYEYILTHDEALDC